MGQREFHRYDIFDTVDKCIPLERFLEGAKRIGEVVTLKKDQWESFLKINEQLLTKCGELQQDVKRLTARNEYLERRLAESGIQTSAESEHED